jgi:hypothetical protein
MADNSTWRMFQNDGPENGGNGGSLICRTDGEENPVTFVNKSAMMVDNLRWWTKEWKKLQEFDCFIVYTTYLENCLLVTLVGMYICGRK